MTEKLPGGSPPLEPASRGPDRPSRPERPADPAAAGRTWSPLTLRVSR